MLTVILMKLLSFSVSGVRMDLDEIFVSLSRKDEQEPVAFGRDLFKSVFDVVSSNAESALNISIGSSELIKDCVNILLSQTHRVILKPSNLTGMWHGSIQMALFYVFTGAYKSN